MEEKVKRLIAWSKDKNQHPTQIQAHLTDFCNLKCSFCPTRVLLKKSELKKDKELTKEEWFRLIEESKGLEVKEWHICGGGEPFFDQNLAHEVLVKIKKEGFHGEIITNGTLFTEEIIKDLVEQEWDKVTFSIDGYNAKMHDSIRGVPCFKAAIRNIHLFSQYKNKLGKDKPRLSFHTVVCNKNYNSLPRLFKLAKKLNVQNILFNALNIWSEEIKKLELSEKQQNSLNKDLENLENLAKKLNIGTNIAELQKLDIFNKANKIVQAMKKECKTENTLLNAPCYMPWYNLSIFADGRVQPCFILQDTGESCKEKSLKEIWLSPYFDNARQSMINKKLNKVCSRCNPWSFSKNTEIHEELRKITF